MVNSKVYKEILAEEVRQIGIWGEQNHPCIGDISPEWVSEHFEIPTEEKAKFLCEEAFRNGEGTYAHIMVEEMSEAVNALNINSRRAELVQLAAVCVSWIKKIDRDIAKNG
jgi:hypothetical protein